MKTRNCILHPRSPEEAVQLFCLITHLCKQRCSFVYMKLHPHKILERNYVLVPQHEDGVIESSSIFERPHGFDGETVEYVLT